MVPDKFNMVDMGGIDLIMMQGEEVPGLYDRLVESIAQCRYQCLYNWLFDGVVIPPSYVKMEVNDEDEVEINEGVTVSSDDVIHIYSLEPGVVPLLAEENGIYNVPDGVAGFNPVTVNVSREGYYCKIEILSPLNKISYVPYGGSFHFVDYFYYDNQFYECSIDLDQVVESLVLNPFDYSTIAETNFNIRQILGNYSISVDGLDLILTKEDALTDTSGIILTGSSDLTAKYVTFNYRQCGRCTTTATLPSIQNQGSGRIYYTSPADNTLFTISYVASQDFFISGNCGANAKIVVTNFIKEY